MKKRIEACARWNGSAAQRLGSKAEEARRGGYVMRIFGRRPRALWRWAIRKSVSHTTAIFVYVIVGICLAITAVFASLLPA
jgi:hypothetical protein